MSRRRCDNSNDSLLSTASALVSCYMVKLTLYKFPFLIPYAIILSDLVIFVCPLLNLMLNSAVSIYEIDSKLCFNSRTNKKILR